MNFFTEAVSRIRKMVQRVQSRPASDKNFIASRPPKTAGDKEPNETRITRWCKGFNRRNGYIVPAKSARSIFYAAMKGKTGRSVRGAAKAKAAKVGA